jgi:hypothetical protein
MSLQLDDKYRKNKLGNQEQINKSSRKQTVKTPEKNEEKK